jgi:hypothetical protein
MDQFKTDEIDKAILALLKAVTDQPGLTTVQVTKGNGENFYRATLNHSREYRLPE